MKQQSTCCYQRVFVGVSDEQAAEVQCRLNKVKLDPHHNNHDSRVLKLTRFVLPCCFHAGASDEQAAAFHCRVHEELRQGQAGAEAQQVLGGDQRHGGTQGFGVWGLLGLGAHGKKQCMVRA
jgi:hypothetical protein